MATTAAEPASTPERSGSNAAEHSTAPEQPGPGWTRFEQAMRALIYLIVFGVVGAALLGVAGLRTREVAASSDRFEVRVTYAQATRAGLSTPFEIEVRAADGSTLPEHLEVRVTSDYLAMFDENGLDPEPGSATSDGVDDTWRFEIDPDATRFAIDLDARVQPNVHSGETGTVRVAEPGGAPVEVEFRTWVLP